MSSRLVLLLDCSSSMYGQVDAVVESVNALLEETRKSALPEMPVTVFAFNQFYRKLCSTTLQDWKPLTAYEADGETALYDSIFMALNRYPKHSTFVVVTDGRDTASQSTLSEVSVRIEQARTCDGCKFVFVGQGGEDMLDDALEMGVAATDVYITRDSLADMVQSQDVMDSISQSLSHDVNSPIIKRAKK